MSDEAAAQSAVVRKLAKRPLLSRLFASGRQPLKLVAVPRDHVQGDRQRGEALLAGRFVLGSEMVSLNDLDFSALRLGQPVGRHASGLLLAPRPLRRGVPRKRRARSPRRWRGAGCSRTARASTTPGGPICGASASSTGRPTRPTSCRAATRATARPCSTRSFAAPAISTPMRTRPRRASTGSPPGAGVVAAGLLVQGGVPRVARGESGLARALVDRAIRGWGTGQPTRRTSRCCWSIGSRFCAVPISRPSKAFPTQSRPPQQQRSPRFMASPWATARCRAGRAAIPVKPRGSHALVEGCGLRARPLRQARGWGYHRLSRARHRAGHRRRTAAASEDGVVRLRVDPGVRNVATDRSGWWSIAAGPAPLPTALAARSGRGAAHDGGAQHARHFRHQFDRDPARRLARQGRRGCHDRPQRGQ